VSSNPCRKSSRAEAALTSLLTLFFVVLTCTDTARAFESRRTESGLHVRWQRASVPIRIAPAAPCGPSSAEIRQALEMATEAWRGIGESPDVVAESGRPPREPGYDPHEPDGNGVYVVCDWPYGALLAVTVGSHDAYSGEILDADILINGDARLSVLHEPDEPDEAHGASHRDFDLASVVTHEVGHVLGLEESGVRGATMWPTTRRGETEQRTLEIDDEEGIAAMYQGAPGNVAVTACTAAPGRIGHARRGSLVMLLLAGIALARRRRRAREGRSIPPPPVTQARLDRLAVEPAPEI
jgi:hypothetical protein